MRNLIIGAFLMFTGLTQAQDITIIHVNAKWNSHNDLEIRNIKGARVQYAILEEQSDNLKKRVTSVPTLLVYKESRLVHTVEAGLTMTLNISREEIQKIVNSFKDNGN